jgi:hypothetical protein
MSDTGNIQGRTQLRHRILTALLLVMLAGCAGERRLVVVPTGDVKPASISASAQGPAGLAGAVRPEHPEIYEEEVFSPPSEAESIKYVFRIVREVVSGKPVAPAESVESAPEELKSPYEGHVFLSAYGERAKLFKAAGKGGSAIEAVLNAAAGLAKAAKGKLPEDISSLPVVVDFTETLLPAEPPGEAQRRFLPGIDGLWLDKDYRLPAEILTYSPSRRAGIALYFSLMPDVELFRRFRTKSFLQMKEGGKALALTRSLPPVPEASPELLNERVIAACEYLKRIQDKDGSYAYVYSTARDRFPRFTEESLVRHAGVTAMMAIAGRALGRQDFIESASRSFTWLQARLQRQNGKAYLLKEGEGTLGSGALLAWAACAYRQATGSDKYDQIAHEAVNFILHLQKPDGLFYGFYDPVSEKPVERHSHYYPGEACLALCWYHKVYGGQKYLDAALKGAEALCRFHDRTPATGAEAIDAWLMQAAPLLYPHASEEQRALMTATCRRMADLMTTSQLTKQNAEYPDLVGAFGGTAASPPSGPGAAALCEGLAGAYQLFKAAGKPDDKLRQTLVNAAHFQLRHQYWEGNTYFLPNPERARGGITGTLIDNEVRIDHVQHTIGIWLQLMNMLKEKPDSDKP